METKSKAQLAFEAKVEKRIDELFKEFMAYKELPSALKVQKVNESITKLLNGFVATTGLMRTELMFMIDTGLFKASGDEGFSEELLEAFDNVGSVLDKQRQKTDNE